MKNKSERRELIFIFAARQKYFFNIYMNFLWVNMNMRQVGVFDVTDAVTKAACVLIVYFKKNIFILYMKSIYLCIFEYFMLFILQ